MAEDMEVEYEIKDDEKMKNSEKQDNAASGSKGKSEFGKSLKDYIDRGVEISMKGFRTAGSKISEFGDKSVIHLDISQLNSKIDKLHKEIGALVSEKMLSGESTVTCEEEYISGRLSEIRELKNKIAEKEELLKKYEKN